MEINELRPIGKTGLDVPALGLGCAAFGGLYQPANEDTILTLLDAAWAAGLRYFDVAPMYGLGRAEHLLGHFLRERVAADANAIISTKVGRLMARGRPGHELPPAPPSNPFDSGWHNGLNFQEVFDYSYDGIMRSFDDSQQRLGTPAIDMLFVHDIGTVTHGDRASALWTELINGGFRALTDLRDAGIIKAFGLGVNETQVIADAMDATDPDCCLLAGRYSLLDRGADELLMKAHERGMAMILGGVFNSGILAGGAAKFDYADAPDNIIAKTKAMTVLCDRHDVPLGAAAIQFPLRHRGVTSVVVGARTAMEIATNVDWFTKPIPEELWDSLAELD